MSTFTSPSQLPKVVKHNVDQLVASQFTKDLLPMEVPFVTARRKEAQFVAHKSRYVPINAPAKTFLPKTGGAGPNEEDKDSGHMSPLTMTWKKPIGSSRGFVNYGNTCFLNSALQCIVNTPPLVQYLLTMDDSCPFKGERKFCAFCELRKLVRASFDKSRSHEALKPHAIASNLRQIGSTFRPGRQEDAHELIRELLAKCDETATKHFSLFLEYYTRPVAPLLPGESPPPPPKPTSLLFAIFGSFLRSRVTCQKCHYNSDTFDPYMDLSIELRGGTLEKSLRHFTSPEQLDVDNMYKCGKCKKRTQPIKTLGLWQPPNILTIQLKRFNIFGQKINKTITYPESLNLGPYFASDSPFASASVHTYHLYGVLLHHGNTARSGHYTAKVKASSGTWVNADDSYTSPASVRSVLDNHDAYILFYTRKDPIPSDSKRFKTVDVNAQRKKVQQHQEQVLAAMQRIHSANGPSTQNMDVDEASSSSSSSIEESGKATKGSDSSSSDSETASSSDSQQDSSSDPDSTLPTPQKIPIPIANGKLTSPNGKLATPNGKSPTPNGKEAAANGSKPATKSMDPRQKSMDVDSLLFGSHSSSPLSKVAQQRIHDNAAAFKSSTVYGGNTVNSWSFVSTKDSDDENQPEQTKTHSKTSQTDMSKKTDKKQGEDENGAEKMDVDGVTESAVDAQIRIEKMANIGVSEMRRIVKENRKKERSEYDKEYDRGKQRKVRKQYEDDDPSSASHFDEEAYDSVPNWHRELAPKRNVFQEHSEALQNNPHLRRRKVHRGGADRAKRLHKQEIRKNKILAKKKQLMKSFSKKKVF